MMYKSVCGVLLAVGLAWGIPAHAAVDDSGASGFAVRESADIAASPDVVYHALTTPQRWWNSDHTFSQDAANLSLEARAGGCWCEKLPGGGSVQHMTVVAAIPGKLLRLRGALGPLQAMAADGAMSISIAPGDNRTRVTLTYLVGGYSKTGFSEIAPAVDEVLGEQMMRLKTFVETGAPVSVSPPGR